MNNELALYFRELFFSLVKENSCIFIFQEQVISTYDNAAEPKGAFTQQQRRGQA